MVENEFQGHQSSQTSARGCKTRSAIGRRHLIDATSGSGDGATPLWQLLPALYVHSGIFSIIRALLLAGSVREPDILGDWS